MAAAPLHGPSTPRPGTAVPFSFKYEASAAAPMSRSESDPLGIKKSMAAVQKRITVEEYLGAKLILTIANRVGFGKEGSVYVVDAPNLKEKLQVSEVAYKHLMPQACRPQSPDRQTGDVHALDLNDQEVGFVQTYAIVVRNGDDPTTEHVVTQPDEFRDELKELEPKIKAAETDPAYLKAIAKLEEEIDELEEDVESERELGSSDGLIEMVLNQITAKKEQLDALKIKHRCKIVGIIMQRLHGMELHKLIVTNGVLSGRRALNYSLQILKALKFMHDKKQMHRDLKAENILIDEKDLKGGRLGTIRIADFSMGKYLGIQGDPRIQTSCGSPHYASPEVWMEAPYDKTADIYSAGIVMYAMISGSLPFDDDDIRQLGSIIRDYGKGNHSSFEYYTGTIDKGGVVRNPLTAQAINKTQHLMLKLKTSPEKIFPALAHVLVGLTKGTPADRMTLENAIDILEKADQSQIQIEAGIAGPAPSAAAQP